MYIKGANEGGTYAGGSGHEVQGSALAEENVARRSRHHRHSNPSLGGINLI